MQHVSETRRESSFTDNVCHKNKDFKTAALRRKRPFFFLPIISTPLLQILPTCPWSQGGLLSAEIKKTNKSRSQFSFHTETKGSGAGSLWFIAAVQRGAQAGRQLIC